MEQSDKSLVFVPNDHLQTITLFSKKKRKKAFEKKTSF